MRRFHPDKKTLKQCHIYGMLAAHAKERHLSFHTPGHKSGAWDITELSYSDNLSCPQGVIAQAERDCAEILGADRSFFLTDGSTSGVLSMLHAASVRSLAFPKNAHKSVYNGCRILGITPVLLEVPTLSKIPLQPTREEMSEKIKAADALLLVTPDYYGNLADLAFARKLCDREGKLLLADGAHGGHLHFRREIYAGTYADLWVDGVHKSLPALTQGAVVSARTPELSRRLKESADIFRTTSPSYPIMASVEYGVKFMAERGAALCARVRADLAKAREILLNAGIACLPSDTLVLAPDLGTAGLYPHEMAAALRAHGIYAELETDRHLLFYNSPFTPRGALPRLARRMAKLEERLPRSAALPAGPVACTERAVGYAEACAAPFEWVAFADAAGRVCARNAGVTPPCYPVALAGERISEEAAAALGRAAHTFGTEGGKVAVLREQS